MLVHVRHLGDVEELKRSGLVTTHGINHLMTLGQHKVIEFSRAGPFRILSWYEPYSKELQGQETYTVGEFLYKVRERTQKAKEETKEVQQENGMNVYMVCAVKRATVAQQENGKYDEMVGDVQAVCANDESGATAQYTQKYLKDVDLVGVEVLTRSFR